MTDLSPPDVLSRVTRAVAQVLAKSPGDILPSHSLIADLGADSLDLVELMYVLEDEFGMRLDKQDLSLSAQLGLPEEEVHQNEILTEKALELLRARHPHAQDLLAAGVTRAQLAPLLTVGSLADGMAKKMDAKGGAHA